MKQLCRVLISLASFLDIVVCELCLTSGKRPGTQVFLSCDSCCGPDDEEYCCEDDTTTSTTTETATTAPQWWVVGVCGGISILLVVIFVVALLVCTKKKMQERMLATREMSLAPASTFHETSFTRAITVEPARPPPYSMETPTDRPPSYQSQRSARRSGRYSERSLQNSRTLAPLDTNVLPTIRPPDSGGLPDYTTMCLSDMEEPTPESSSQINTQTVSRLSDNRSANRSSSFSVESPRSPPPPYSRHAYE